MSFVQKVSSESYSEILPYHEYTRTESGWRDSLVTGNGENGVVCSCSPYSDTLIYQNMYFIMPTTEPRFTPPEVTKELHEARQAVIGFDDTWNVHGRKRTFLYRFHPGHQVRLEMPKGQIQDYTRELSYESGEIIVRYTDDKGKWCRKTFTSREDNVTITKIEKSDTGAKIHAGISIDNVSSMVKFGRDTFWKGQKRDEENLLYKKLSDDEGSFIAMVAHYPAYEGSELSEGGYAGMTRILVSGGTVRRASESCREEAINVGADKHPVINISDADAVYLISRTDRTHHMGSYDEFSSVERYALVDGLKNELDKVIQKYTDAQGDFSYEAALMPHRKKQSSLFNAVSFRLGSGNDSNKTACNEALIQKQKDSGYLVDAFVERAYNQGRYAQICCAGYSAPRLCGMWTGEWNPGWSGAYTMDANVNLQVSGMNTGNVYDAALGYIYFILRQIKDWRENAEKVYSMKDALLVPVNTDGDIAIMVEYDQDFPFQYWNAGASWMLLPIYEFWQCYGNCKVPVIDKISHLYRQDSLDLERDILYPLLKMQANFWKQLCTPEYFTDKNGKACYSKGKTELADGERFLIIPSYSPENKPCGYDSTITANATMDISAARDGLKMMIQLEKALMNEGYELEVKQWEELILQLPEYKYDMTGALCEWAMNEYKENNEHRHISHLYCAWPAYEAQNDLKLTEACNTVIANRNRENAGKDDTASHGWVHKALVAARLKNGKSVYDLLYTIMSSDIYFTSFMTDHNTDRSIGVYCTDTSIGTVGIINEMLLYSNTGEIELLPALPEQWKEGAMNGLMARTNAQVSKLEWDINKAIVTASIRSHSEQSIKISCRVGKGCFRTSDGIEYANGDILSFKQGEEKTILVCF